MTFCQATIPEVRVQLYIRLQVILVHKHNDVLFRYFHNIRIFIFNVTLTRLVVGHRDKFLPFHLTLK